jgi:crotonobetaine/carnitine-CoA ligase
VTADLIGNRTLPMLLDEHSEQRPGARALVFEDSSGSVREWTYRRLAEDTRRAAAGFAGIGVRAGDKVVVHLPNVPELLLTIFGLARLGAVAVPSNTANGARELHHIVSWSDASLVVTSARLSGVFDELGDAMAPVRATVIAGGGERAGQPAFDELLTAPPAGAFPELDAETPLEILFTSGTTAAPKGVVLTHANWLWSGERSSRTLLLDEHDRLLSGLPLFHVNAQSLTLMNALTLGATAIFLEQYSASRFLDQVRAHAATHISIVAMIVRTLLAQPADPRDREHALRRVSYAINVSDAEKDEFEERFGVALINGYGLSEAMTEVAVCPVHGPGRWPSIGRPVFDRRVRIVDPEDRDVPVGQSGEIIVHGVPGRTIFKEYYKDPAATADAIRGGWLHTGDNGRLDELGFLYFVDRLKDIIKRAGENVSASEVEAVLVEHPDIAQAAVIGIPDPIRDEAVKAFVVARSGAELTADDVVAHCAERLAAFKVPTVVEFLDALPTTSIGKVEKKALRARATETVA